MAESSESATPRVRAVPDGRRETKPAPGPMTRPCRPADELEVLIRARYPIIYVVSWEEERVEQRLSAMARGRNKQLYSWTYTQGITKYGAEPQRVKSGTGT